MLLLRIYVYNLGRHRRLGKKHVERYYTSTGRFNAPRPLYGRLSWRYRVFDKGNNNKRAI